MDPLRIKSGSYLSVSIVEGVKYLVFEFGGVIRSTSIVLEGGQFILFHLSEQYRERMGSSRTGGAVVALGSRNTGLHPDCCTSCSPL